MNKQGLYVGIGVCVLFTAAALLTSTEFSLGGEPRILLDLGPLNYTQHNYMLGVYSHIVLFGVAWAASYFFPAREVDRNLTYAGWKDRKRSEACRMSKSDDPSVA